MNHIATAERLGQIDYTRGRGFLDPTAIREPVTIVGCGGIGSPLAMALAKMGVPHLRLIDGDTVEKHNLPNQMFPLSSLGMPKPLALADEIARYSPTQVEVFDAMVTEDTFPGGRPRGVVVLALDSIAARTMIWQKWLHRNIGVSRLVDPRIGGQSVVLYTADPRRPADITRYEGTLHDPSESVQAPCTMRSIMDVGFSVASLAARAVRLHFAGETPEHTLFWNHRTLSAMVGR